MDLLTFLHRQRVTTIYPESSAAAPTSSYSTLAVNPSYVSKGRHAVLQVNPGATGEGRVQGEVKTH